MKKVFCILTLILCINTASFSQIIDESIPRFGEKLLALSKTSAKNEILNRGFKLFSTEDLISFGHSREKAKKIIAGVGDMKMTCKIEANSTGSYIEKVTIGAVRYLNAKGMINEYKKEGYILDENNSTSSELIFVKKKGKYTYVAFVEFMINPNMCIANAEFRRVVIN